MWPYVVIIAGGVMALVGWIGCYRMASRRPGLVLALEEWQQVRHALAGRVSWMSKIEWPHA